MTEKKATRRRRKAVEIEFHVEFEPDEEREARGMLLLLGFPPEEIEHIILEMKKADPPLQG